MTPPVLIRDQQLDAWHRVQVWKCEGLYNGQPAVTYRKVWEGKADGSSTGWLSWGLHEQLLLTLLAERGVRSAVTTLGLNQDTHRIELSTLDAGPELQRDWLHVQSALRLDTELVKLCLHTLQALVQIHQLGVVHGDLKADNVCVSETTDARTGNRCLNWRSLKLIDFAFSLSRDHPLRVVLPLKTSAIDYHPSFYLRAVERSQQTRSPEGVQAVCSAAIDLYGLGVLLQKQIVMAGHPCPGASLMAKACLQAGSRQQPWRWPWSTTRFEAQTLRLTQKALDWLRAQGLSDEEIGRSVPLAAPTGTTATPLGSVEATPLAGASPTPLLRPSQPTETRPPEAPPPADDPVPAAQSLWTRGYWVVVTLLLTVCFILIDQGYRTTKLVLSNSGYIAALLAILAGWPLVHSAYRQVSRPTPRGHYVCVASAVLLAIVALFHAASVMRAGLHGTHAGLLVTALLLTLGMVARRATGIASTTNTRA